MMIVDWHGAVTAADEQQDSDDSDDADNDDETCVWEKRRPGLRCNTTDRQTHVFDVLLHSHFTDYGNETISASSQSRLRYDSCSHSAPSHWLKA